MSKTSIREAFVEASSFLEQHAIQDSAFCAELLLRHLLQWERSTFFLHWNEPFPMEKKAEWDRLIARKAEGEPVQYIIGEQEFYGLPFSVNKAVLIPRPETEILVEHIIRHGNELWSNSSPLLVDIGAGSGAISVTIAHRCPKWHIIASDISPDALQVAKENARRNHVEKRITFMQGDLLTPMIEQQSVIDILVSNPPYIEKAQIASLQKEVRDYEPHTALDGGIDGLQLYRKMIQMLDQLPQYPRLIGFEVGQGQAEAVADMLRNVHFWDQICIVPDLAGIDRHVLGIRENLLDL